MFHLFEVLSKINGINETDGTAAICGEPQGGATFQKTFLLLRHAIDTSDTYGIPNSQSIIS